MSAPNKNLIYLTGFMGSGKSTIGPILANTLGFSFVDIDKEIEHETGKKITEIFSDLGEEFFREVERSILRQLSRREGCVIALGGGTITNDVNLEIVKTTGTLIYLKVNVEQIYRRLRYKTDRPLLRPPSGPQAPLEESELRARILTLLEKREPFYTQADLIVTTDEQRVGITVDEIVSSLRERR
jgi:shikimate kinase